MQPQTVSSSFKDSSVERVRLGCQTELSVNTAFYFTPIANSDNSWALYSMTTIMRLLANRPRDLQITHHYSLLPKYPNQTDPRLSILNILKRARKSRDHDQLYTAGTSQKGRVRPQPTISFWKQMLDYSIPRDTNGFPRLHRETSLPSKLILDFPL